MLQIYHHVDVLVTFPRQIGGENPSHGGLNKLHHHVEVYIIFPRQIGEEKLVI
jgi:hypothetical protein